VLSLFSSGASLKLYQVAKLASAFLYCRRQSRVSRSQRSPASSARFVDLYPGTVILMHWSCAPLRQFASVLCEGPIAEPNETSHRSRLRMQMLRANNQLHPQRIANGCLARVLVRSLIDQNTMLWYVSFLRHTMSARTQALRVHSCFFVGGGAMSSKLERLVSLRRCSAPDAGGYARGAFLRLDRQARWGGECDHESH
jgi:hypothetical protein